MKTIRNMKNMKKIVYVLSIVVLLTLSGCGLKDEGIQKQNFYIQTKGIS